MRVCCALTHHLELAQRRDLYGTPVVIGRWEEHVIAASEEAMAFGIARGMPLRHAEHLCPQATFLPPDEEASQGTKALRLLGALQCTGLKPHFLEKMAGNGVVLPAAFFENEEEEASARGGGFATANFGRGFRR